MENHLTSLFPAEPLLEQRLGAERFESIPPSPGVYRFYSRTGELLYVGKAKNLRRRLFSYKRAKAGGVSRKVSRMIGQIASFVYVETETERDALLLENRMIRGERPPFNHVNKQTEAYYFVYLKPDESGLEFRLAMRIHEDTEEAYWHGCYKGHTPVRQSLGCLLRLLQMAEYGIQSPMHLPVQLTRNLTPMRYWLPWRGGESPALQNGIQYLLERWIKGESCEILDWFIVQIECGKRLTPFQTLHLEYHLECLKRFYDQKLVRHRNMRGDRNLIGQEDVDDLMVYSLGALGG
jgi:hypothetical protein